MALAWPEQGCLVLFCLSAAPAAVRPGVQVHRGEHPAVERHLWTLGSFRCPEGISFPVNPLIKIDVLIAPPDKCSNHPYNRDLLAPPWSLILRHFIAAAVSVDA